MTLQAYISVEHSLIEQTHVIKFDKRNIFQGSVQLPGLDPVSVETALCTLLANDHCSAISRSIDTHKYSLLKALAAKSLV